eukprot:751432-Hanusia_phi.AAC.1
MCIRDRFPSFVPSRCLDSTPQPSLLVLASVLLFSPCPLPYARDAGEIQRAEQGSGGESNVSQGDVIVREGCLPSCLPACLPACLPVFPTLISCLSHMSPIPPSLPLLLVPLLDACSTSPQAGDYTTIVNGAISEKMREMQAIDKKLEQLGL